MTCEAVLSETAFHLGSSELALAMVSDGLVRVEVDFRKEWKSIQMLAARFADQAPDLADLCTLRLSELNSEDTVLTVDAAHFRVLRRNKRERVPALFPPEK